MNILSFSNEVIVLILSNLFFEDIVNVAQTCKKLRLILCKWFNYKNKMGVYIEAFISWN